MTDLRFKEIEHKFVVPASFDTETLRRTLDALGPRRRETLRVRDRYFVTEAGRARGFVLRHRHDRELHELTLKTVGADAEVRDEINVALRAEDQDAVVEAFAAAQGIVWQGTLWKDLDVWYFDDCEVVCYRAQTTDREIRCVEFEAVHQTTLEAALAVVRRYEAAVGFAEADRTPASLVDLMWPGVLTGRRLTP